MKAFVCLMNSDNYDIDDLLEAFEENNKKVLIDYVKQALQNSGDLNFEYETPWDTYDMYMSVVLLKEVDEVMVDFYSNFMYEAFDNSYTTYVLNTEELV